MEIIHQKMRAVAIADCRRRQELFCFFALKTRLAAPLAHHGWSSVNRLSQQSLTDPYDPDESLPPRPVAVSSVSTNGTALRL